MRRTMSLFLTIGILLSACSSETGVAEGSGEETRSTVAEGAAEADLDVPSGIAEGDQRTLEDFIPGGWQFGGVDSERRLLELQSEVQDRVATCMAEQGFEYIPWTESHDQSDFSGPDAQEQWVEEYGFGLATQTLGDPRTNEEKVQAATAQNPNNALVDAMSALERDAYRAALHGAPLDSVDGYESMTDEEVREFEESHPGCYPAVQEDVYGLEALEDFTDQFGSMVKDIDHYVEADPRILELDAAWSSCMAEKGYDFAAFSDATTYVLRRLEEVGAITNVVIEAEGMGYGYKPEEFESGGPIEAAVGKIATEEIAIAGDSLACSAVQDVIRREVRREAEQRFVQEHLVEFMQFEKDHS